MSKVETRYNIEAETPNLSNYFGGNSMLKTTMLTQARLKELFNYDAEISKLRYKKHTNNRIKVGDVVGCISDGYRMVRINKVIYKHSRLVWMFHYGSFPINNIDHINGDRDDDSLSNLRDVTQEENRKNCAMTSQNTSGIQGVSLYKRTGRWRAFIGNNKKRIHLGYFKTQSEAVQARREAEIKYGFHENHGRIT